MNDFKLIFIQVLGFYRRIYDRLMNFISLLYYLKMFYKFIYNILNILK